jgi:hypothetical protein
MAHFFPSNSKRGGRWGAAAGLEAAGGDPALGLGATAGNRNKKKKIRLG